MSTAAVNAVVARTSALLDQLPADQLAGASSLTDAIDTLSDAELLATAQAVAVTATKAPTPAIRNKAVKVLQVAKDVAKARAIVRPKLAATKPYPEAFVKSAAGQKAIAVSARRFRMGDDPTSAATGGNAWGPSAGASVGPTRRPTGPLAFYTTWVNQGKWGRSDGQGRGGMRGFDDTRPRDAVEAVIMGRPVPQAEAVGLMGLAGLNLGKFFKNLVKDVAPVVGIASMIPGVGSILGTIGAAVGQQQQQAPAQQYAAPTVYGPAPQQPQAESKVPGWAWAVGGVAAVGLVAALATRR